MHVPGTVAARSQPRPSRSGALLLLLTSLAGFAFSAYAWYAPLTGVTDSIGALVVTLVCVVLAIMALALMATSGRIARNALRVLVLTGLVGTCFAGLLLHRWGIAVAMAIGLIGLLLDMSHTARTGQGSHGVRVDQPTHSR